MNLQRALPFSRLVQFALVFPGKIASKSAGVAPAYTTSIDSPSHSLVIAQILWFGIGVTLFSDTAEKILNWPHLLVVALSSLLMIASAWFSLRALLVLCLATLPGILSALYFSLKHQVPGTEGLALWTQMISMKSMEYISGLLIMMGYCIRPQAQPNSSTKKMNWSTVLACLGFMLGNALVIASSMKVSMADNQVSFSTALAEQGSTIVGLLLLGFSARSANAQKLSQLGNILSRFTKFPLKGLVVIVGVSCAIFTDWFSQYLYGWLYYASSLFPPLAMIIVSKFLFRQPQSQP